MCFFLINEELTRDVETFRTFGMCSNILNSIRCKDEMMLGVVTVVRKYCGAMYSTAEMTANKLRWFKCGLLGF